jgi:hypothetical protein
LGKKVPASPDNPRVDGCLIRKVRRASGLRPVLHSPSYPIILLVVLLVVDSQSASHKKLPGGPVEVPGREAMVGLLQGPDHLSGIQPNHELPRRHDFQIVFHPNLSLCFSVGASSDLRKTIPRHFHNLSMGVRVHPHRRKRGAPRNLLCVARLSPLS